MDKIQTPNTRENDAPKTSYTWTKFQNLDPYDLPIDPRTPSGYCPCCKKQLQAAQPQEKPTTDIDAIIRELENDKYKKYHNRSLSQDEWVYNQALNMAIHIISKHLTQKTTVPKDGEVSKKCKENHIRINAMQGKEDKIRQLWTEVLRQLESSNHYIHEQIGNTWIYSDILYLSINQS